MQKFKIIHLKAYYLFHLPMQSLWLLSRTRLSGHEHAYPDEFEELARQR